MRRRATPLALVLLLPVAAAAQDALPRPADLRWEGALGGRDAEPSTIYCLMGSGFFRAETSSTLDATRDEWLRAHPNASLRAISTISPLSERDPKSRLVYVWIVDGTENLGLHLVGQGCFPGGTLLVHDPGSLQIGKEEYAAFVARAKAAEAAAREGTLGLWGDPRVLIEGAEERARTLLEEGKHEAALRELERVVQLGGADEGVWLSIATCEERLGRYEAALAAHDKAIGGTLRWGPILERARCVSRNEGAAAAVAWLEGLTDRWAATDRTPHHLLGEFHMSERRFAEAVPHFERAVEVASKAQGFGFTDEGWLILDAATLAKENNDFCELWPTLQYMSQSLLQLKRMNDAFRYATMGVAIGQQLNRCKGYYDQPQVAAGDVDCRLVRAWVLMDRRDLDGAQAEISHARVLAEQSAYAGWITGVKRAQGALDRLKTEAEGTGR